MGWMTGKRPLLSLLSLIIMMPFLFPIAMVMHWKQKWEEDKEEK